MLVCGPPGAGKSTYVRRHASADDVVIDLDMIARERGLDLDRPSSVVAMLLRERNDRLAALAEAPADRVAWVIICAPSRCLRQWWCETLNVQPGDLIVLTPTRTELVHRIMADPERRLVVAAQIELVDRWLAKERQNDPGILRGGVTPDGFPTDPLHRWNR